MVNLSSASNVLPFPVVVPPAALGEAYAKGLADGKKCADERYFWMGIGAGFMMLFCVALALYFCGFLPL